MYEGPPEWPDLAYFSLEIDLQKVKGTYVINHRPPSLSLFLSLSLSLSLFVSLE